MRVGVLGTGSVGHALATRLVELGHDVLMGSRSASNEKARQWAAGHPERAAAGTFADAAGFAERVIVNATAGTSSLAALQAAGEENLGDKVLIDVANAISAFGPPPTLDPVGDDSLAEQIQRAFPRLRVVKALNTMNADVMAHPASLPGEHDVFMAGNDLEAKATVRTLLQEIGWPEVSIRDVGDLTAARGLEMYLVFWIGLRMTIGHNDFNIRVVT